MVKKICALTNCQGNDIFQAMRTLPIVQEQFTFKMFANYADNDMNAVIAGVKEADIILYQPLPLADIQKMLHHHADGPIPATRATYSPEYLLTFKKAEAITISIPYIYCNWLWSVYTYHSTLHDGNVIKNLLTKHSPEKILHMYRNNEINFELKARMEASIEILKDKEKNTDVKVVEYILENYKHKRLFYICNHITKHIAIHCANQVLQFIGIPEVIPENTNIGEHNDKRYSKIDRYAKTELGLHYDDEDDNASDYCYRIIKSYINKEDLLSYFNTFKEDLYK